MLCPILAQCNAAIFIRFLEMEKVVEGIIESIKAEQEHGDLSDAQTAFNSCILHWQLVRAIMDRDHRRLVFDHGRLVGLSECMDVDEDGNPFAEAGEEDA